MEETVKGLEALSGSVSKTDDIDYKAKFEEASKLLQSEKVEAGRLKKANEENAELRKKLAELEAKKQTETVLSELDDNLRDDIPEDYQRGFAQIAQAAVRNSDQNERLARIEAELNEEKSRKRRMNADYFVERIKSSYPGFLESIEAGGDKQQAWAYYQRNNAETISSAINRCDFDTLSYHIQNFYNIHLGIPLPSGYQEESTPDPRSIGGGMSSQSVNVGGGRSYSVMEYQNVLEKAQSDFQEHKITYQRYAEICEEMNNAYKQGRVK